MKRLILWVAEIAVASVAVACNGSQSSPIAVPTGSSGDAVNAASNAAAKAQVASACGLSQDGNGATIDNGPGAGHGNDGPSTSTGNEDGPGLNPGGPAPAGAHAVLVGQVGTVAGRCPALTLTLDAMAVRTSAATSFPGISCDSIRRGQRIGAVGAVQADGSVTASCVAGF